MSICGELASLLLKHRGGAGIRDHSVGFGGGVAFRAMKRAFRLGAIRRLGEVKLLNSSIGGNTSVVSGFGGSRSILLGCMEWFRFAGTLEEGQCFDIRCFR